MSYMVLQLSEHSHVFFGVKT